LDWQNWGNQNELKGGTRVRSRNIQADIDNMLDDGHWHTMAEIAREIEVSRCSVQRHIAALAYRNPSIEIRCGRHGGGVRKIVKRSLRESGVTQDELQSIIEVLQQHTDTAGIGTIIAKLRRL